MVLTDLPICFSSVPITTSLSCFGAKIDYGSGSLWCVKLEAIRAPSNAFFPFSSGLKLVIQKHESGILTLQVSVTMSGDRSAVESSLPNVWVLLWKLRLILFFTQPEK